MSRTNEDLDKAAEAFVESMNGGEDDMVRFTVERLRYTHRTIQAHAIRAMVRILRSVGEDPNWGSDLRNEGAVQWCNGLAHLTEGTKPEPSDVEAIRRGFAVW